jgi:hypothetical protein
MSGYTRTTRECSIGQIHPDLYQKIQEYFQIHHLGDMESGTRLCCETISEKRPSSGWRSYLAPILDSERDATIHFAMLLTADRLIWARRGDQSPARVIGCQLNLIQAKAFISSRTRELELQIAGYVGDSKAYLKGVLALGPEPAAQKFCEAVMQANNIANPPPKSSRPKWLGG